MTLLAPGLLALGAAAIVALAALHLLARRRPRAVVLPTARFVPERATRLLSRTLALTDPWLLLLRAAAVAALVLAVAQPVLARRRGPTARVVLIDRSRDVADVAELRDSARAVAVPGATLIAFDSAAARLTTRIDSLRASGAVGSLSAGLAAAIRAGADAAATADSVEIVLVSPLAPRESDAATPAIRASWPGRMRVVRVAARATDSALRPVELRAPEGDAVAAGVAVGVRARAAVRLVRDGATAADRAWLAAAPGRVLVDWPARGLEAGRVARPAGVIAGPATVVAPFAPSRAPAPGTSIARWADGAPAATERAAGAGCMRDVAIPVDERSDLALRPPFRALLAALVAPCGDAGTSALAPAPTPASLAGSGALAARRALASSSDRASPLVPFLLALGIVLLGVEWLVRRGAARPTAAPVA